MICKLTTPGQNMAETRLGAVRLFWSYDTLIAFEGPAGGVFNPVARGLTSTTTTHAGKLGCKGFPDATAPDTFAASLRMALAYA